MKKKAKRLSQTKTKVSSRAELGRLYPGVGASAPTFFTYPRYYDE